MTYKRSLLPLLALGVLAALILGVRQDTASPAPVQQVTPVRVDPQHHPVLSQQTSVLPFLSRAPAGPQQAPASSTGQLGSRPHSATVAGFAAIPASQSACGCFPPDGGLAAGPTQLLATVNLAFGVFAKSGAQLAAPLSLASVLTTAAGCQDNISDPTALYDAPADRWFLAALTYNPATFDSTICVAVSVSGDATGQWNVYAFKDDAAGELEDYPHLVLGDTTVYNSMNLFGTASGVRLAAYDKHAMEAGQATAEHFFRIPTPGVDTLWPAQGVTQHDTGYYVSVENCACSTAHVWQWTGALAGGLPHETGQVALAPYTEPLQADEPGCAACLTPDDTRVMGVTFAAGTLYAAHATSCFADTADCIDWFQLGSIGAAPTLLQEGHLGSAGEFRMYPGLLTDSAGNLLLGYDHSSASDAPGIRAASRLATDPAGSMGAEAVVKAGEITAGGGRWGDYDGDSLDPVDGCTVWHLGEYAQAGERWGTWIAGLRSEGCTGGPPPSPSPSATPSPSPSPSPSPTATPQPGADFTLSLSPASQSVRHNSAATYSVSVQPVGTAAPQPVTLSACVCSGGGAFTATVTPSVLTPPGTATVTVTTRGKPGTFTLTVSGSSGTFAHDATAQLAVTTR